MTLTRDDLDIKYASWFYSVKRAEKAKQEILRLFAAEPDDGHFWTEQDISEQARKIIRKIEAE